MSFILCNLENHSFKTATGDIRTWVFKYLRVTGVIGYFHGPICRNTFVDSGL